MATSSRDGGSYESEQSCLNGGLPPKQIADSARVTFLPSG